MGGTWILAWPPQRWEVARPGRGSFGTEARPRNLQCPGHEFPPCQQQVQRSMGYQCWNFRRRGQRRRQSIPQYQVGPSPRCTGRQGVTPLAGAVQRGGWFTGSCSASKADEVVLTVLAGLGCQWQALAEPWTSPRGLVARGRILPCSSPDWSMSSAPKNERTPTRCRPKPCWGKRPEGPLNLSRQIVPHGPPASDPVLT